MMTHSEIASAMGITRQRVYQIEQRALQKLRRQVKRIPGFKDMLGELADSRPAGYVWPETVEKTWTSRRCLATWERGKKSG